MAGPFALVGAISMPQTDPMTRPADHLDRVATTVAAHLYPRDTRRATVATSHVRYRLHSHPLPPEPLPGPVARHLTDLLSPATLDALHGSASLPASLLPTTVAAIMDASPL